MSEGGDLLGPAPGKRRRGRPKGSTNKRAKDLAAYVGARFGGSAAQQMAAVAMVTPAEVKKAGGVLQARVAKAQELADAIGCNLREAWDLIARELAALAPYTDKRQPLAVEADVRGIGPAVVVQVEAGGLAAMPTDADFVEVFAQGEAEVSQVKSHDTSQELEFPALPGPGASD